MMNQIKIDCEIIPWHSLDVRRELKKPAEGQKQLDKKDQCGAEDSSQNTVIHLDS